MATANLRGSNQSITLEKNKFITITKRTVRFSRNVYQTHNITGFGEGEVEIGTIHWLIITVALILGLGLIFFQGGDFTSMNSQGGLGLILAGIGGAFWNFAKPKRYGFLLTLNSGDKKLVTTTDRKNLKRVIEVIYDIIETEKEVTYRISVTNSKVNGNFIQGYVEGSVLYRSDD